VGDEAVAGPPVQQRIGIYDGAGQVGVAVDGEVGERPALGLDQPLVLDKAGAVPAVEPATPGRSAFVVFTRTAFVCVFVTVTVAPPICAPVASRTLPTIVPLV